MAERICIVENDESIQDIFKIILEKAGYELNVFSDGKAIMLNNYVIPDIFLLDKQLIGVDGLTICRHIKADPATKKIPVIMISANPNIGKLSEEAGADGFVEKPFTVGLLLDTIRSHTQKLAADMQKQPVNIKEEYSSH
jgi:DNA-binding response OmpR family regulator